MVKVSVDGMNAEITKQLSQWYTGLDEDIATIAKEEGKKMVAEVKKDSPKDTGEYSKGWTLKTERSNGYVRIKGYNRIKPSLTHLLEKGHAKQNGGRVDGKPHIFKNEEEANEVFRKRVKELL